MKAKPQKQEYEEDLFRSELSSILDLRHELCQLSEQINWYDLDIEISKLFPSKTGCPALPTRLIMGLFFLKATYKVSDEDLPRKWVENPYWQYFCGEKYFQHKFPIDPSSMSKWRKRLKDSECERLLQETIQVGLSVDVIKKRDLKKVIADSTVQEKAIAFPTDSRLYHKARILLVNQAKKDGLQLRQSYVRLGKQAMFKGSNYARAKHMKRARKQTKKLKTYLGCVYRDIERQLINRQELREHFAELLSNVERLLVQQKHSKNKLYSMHAPEVECIGKGKVHKHYEFGVKVGFVITHKKNFIVGSQALPGNPYDGHTLTGALDQVESLTGIRPDDCFVDLGYRGNKEEQTKIHIGRNKKIKVSRSLKAAIKRRSAIEPIIGHAKSDGHLGRNYLKGTDGDKINAIMSAVGFNLRQILKKLRFLWLYFLCNLFGFPILLNLK